MIVYLRVLPGFCLAAEGRQRPELRSAPAIVGGLPHQRGVVREVNTLAARCGVRAGMTLAQARHYCPDGIFLVPDLPRYQALWEEMLNILQDYTPLVEPVEMGQAACDLSGCERCWGTVTRAAHDIATQMQRQVGITPCLGVASNRLVAQLASSGAGGDIVTVVEQGQERSFLAPLPLTLLPEVDARLALTLNVLGLRTIGQLAALPATAVEQRFGAAGKKLHRYARGIDPRPVSPPPPRPAVTARYECEDGSLEEASAALHRLAETCAAELQRRHLLGTLITLKLLWHEPPAVFQPTETDTVGETPASEYPIHPSVPLDTAPLPAPSLPISYRIHSMLPQPGTTLTPQPPLPPVGEGEQGPSPPGHAMGEGETRDVARAAVPAASIAHTRSSGRRAVKCPPSNTIATSNHLSFHTPPLPPVGEGAGGVRVTTLLRTPIGTAPPLLEHAQRLLLQRWPKSNSCETKCDDLRSEKGMKIGADGDFHRNPLCLQALELEVSEFEAPRQMAFPELLQLDQTGTLGGGVADPRGVLTRQEQLLAARHGQQPFQHAAQVDPDSILAERRFRWQDGLPWDRSSAGAFRKPS